MKGINRIRRFGHANQLNVATNFSLAMSIEIEESEQRGVRRKRKERWVRSVKVKNERRGR